MLTTDDRKKVIDVHKTSEGDTGSPPVQIALLTSRIVMLNEHLSRHRGDNAAKQGLLKLVGKRNRLLRYLKRKNQELYETTIKELGLRK